MSSKPTHVVIVSDFARVEGGGSQVAIQTANGLVGRGYGVTLFAAVGPRDASLDPRILVQLTDQQDIASDRHRVEAALRGVWNGKAARLMRATLSALNPTESLVHVHGWTKALSSSVIRAARDMGFPVLVTLHDYFLACPNGGFFHYPNAEVCTLTPLSWRCCVSACDKQSPAHKAYRLVRQVVQAQLGGLPHGVLYYITPSRFSRTILEPYLPHGAIIYDHPNMVMVEHTPPLTVEAQQAFVMLGRLSEEKGAVVLAEAGRKAGADVVFIGDGSCRGSVLEHNPAARVTGWLDRAGVQVELERARALVLPSHLYEVQPLAVLEAAARGIPALVPAGSAACDYVEDGVTGLWFRRGSVGDLAEKMRQMTGAEAKRMGAVAYARYWEQPWTLCHHLERLDSIYTDVMERERRA